MPEPPMTPRTDLLIYRVSEGIPALVARVPAKRRRSRRAEPGPRFLRPSPQTGTPALRRAQARLVRGTRTVHRFRRHSGITEASYPARGQRERRTADAGHDAE